MNDLAQGDAAVVAAWAPRMQADLVEFDREALALADELGEEADANAVKAALQRFCRRAALAGLAIGLIEARDDLDRQALRSTLEQARKLRHAPLRDATATRVASWLDS